MNFNRNTGDADRKYTTLFSLVQPAALLQQASASVFGHKTQSAFKVMSKT